RIGVQYGSTSELTRVDYGLVGGVGMAFKTGIGDFALEGRYYFGLGDIFTSRRSDNAYFSRSAFRLIEAKLTYYIRIL
ncbi:outer membrane beta-barrel protein, partial [uncultured Proteiniphilum sp.]|uniref:outer membrane beta-barrel protein n=1 Tax=uncultured Proteiniphilum sp. TaxID=497637 RepID=UPI00260EAE38